MRVCLIPSTKTCHFHKGRFSREEKGKFPHDLLFSHWDHVLKSSFVENIIKIFSTQRVYPSSTQNASHKSLRYLVQIANVWLSFCWLVKHPTATSLKYRSFTRRTRITNEDEDFLFRNITRRIYTTSEHKRERLWHFCIKKPSYQDVVKLKIVWFFRQIIYKNCSIRSRISTNQVFLKCGFKNLCFQLPRESMKWRAWLVPVQA